MPKQLKLLEDFFTENQVELEALYPGINQKKIKEFYNDLENEKQDASDLIKKLKTGIPLEHISNKRFFYNSYFFVNESVLIPRFETEMLVELALKEVNSFVQRDGKELKIVEVGVGSGAVILALLKEIETHAEVVVTDVSNFALEVFKINLNELITSFKEEHSVKILESDRLNSVPKGQDIIISNPPYIMKRGDREMVHEQVIHFEPEVALFLEDEEYFEWFDEFIKDAYKKLKYHGVFLMEGHEFHLEKLKEMALEIGFSEVVIKKDLTDRVRFLKAVKGVRNE